MRWLVARREADPWSYLGLVRCSPKAILLSCAVMGVFIAASDTLSWTLGRPLVPPLMTTAYATARSPVLLLLALVVAAPLFEELFFRGFLTSGLRSVGTPAIVNAVATSAAFAAIHFQYDLLGIATIFLMGLLLAAFRFRFGSIIPAVAVHALANLVAFVETALLAPIAA